MDILYLPLEFNRWFSAKKLAYSIGVGLVEGFTPNGIDHLTVPIMYHDQLWGGHLKDLVGDRKFDQVWIEVVHSVIPEHILEWLASLAPVRFGIVIESLTMATEEFDDNPVGTQRRIDNLNQKLPYLTHALVYDTRDLNTLDIPTMQGVAYISEGLVKPPSSTSDKAIFYGTDYGERGEWLKRLEDRLSVNPPSVEDTSDLPHMFEQLFNSTHYVPSEYDYFYSTWYSIRQALYSIWINHLYHIPGCAMVNLPHRTQVLSGRVIENMAAGKPVVSPYMYNDADNLFVNEKEILYYKDIEGLIKWLDELEKNADLRWSLAEAARFNILEKHTTERRVKQILTFINNSN